MHELHQGCQLIMTVLDILIYAISNFIYLKQREREKERERERNTTSTGCNSRDVVNLPNERPANASSSLLVSHKP